MIENSVGHAPPAIARANGIELCYEAFGNRRDPPILLVMGLASQMILWEEDFCKQLAGEGFWVIRFDNRDIGKSSKFPKSGSPGALSLLLTPFTKKFIAPSYTLGDMAADTVGLMDALNITRAHLVGVSMGGMIAQEVAIRYPARLLSLTSIMSTTGDTKLPRAEPQALAVLLKATPKNHHSYMERYTDTWRVLSGDVMPLDPARTIAQGELGYSRGINPKGVARQLKAIIAAPDRTQALAHVTVPTLVMHGSKDPLVPIAHGRATAHAIPGSNFEVIDGMGHALPRAAWPQLIAAIARHARAATTSPPA